MKDLLIIGAGPTGLYAWYCAQLLHLSGNIIEKREQIGGQAMEFYADKWIYDLPCISQITGRKMINNLKKQIKSTREQTCTLIQSIKKIELNTQPDNLYKINFYPETKSTFSETYKTILITSGNGSLEPVKLESRHPMSSFDNIKYKIDNKTLKQFKNKKIIILGGGDSAIDWANFLKQKKITKQISIVHRRTFYRAKQTNIDKLSINQIQEYKGYLIDDTNFKQSQKKLKNLIIINKLNKAQVVLPCDYILVQYGFLINMSYINNWPLNFTNQRKIKIKTNCETNMLNIFAVGDAVDYPGKYHNLTSGFGEVVNAIFNISKIINGSGFYPVFYGTNRESNKNDQ